jgi:hypothetical protein
MRPAGLLLLIILLVGGCAVGGTRRPAEFGPRQVRVSPVFSRVIDERTYEADVELLDAFGDSVKGGGVLTLELFEYDPNRSGARGVARGRPRQVDLGTLAAQRRFWRGVSRTYSVSVQSGGLDPTRTYVLVVRYQPATTTGPAADAAAERPDRLEAQTLLRPRATEPTTAPTR